jgi:large subunit ribosomal protein L13Ae
MFEKEIVIDGRGHLLGRLASKVAKELLNGQRIVVVRTELLMKSGSLFRSKLEFAEFHYRTPSRIFWRVVRGMLPHKTPRGAAALGRLKVFEGIPFPYDHRRRMVVPEALKILRLKDNRKYTVLGDLAKESGWTRKDVVERLEAKRKEKSQKFFELKQRKIQAREKAKGSQEVAKFNTELAKYGF